jgi:hypothetical protein
MTVSDNPYVLNLAKSWGTPFSASPFGGRYISTFVYTGLRPNRYFLLLTSRIEEPVKDGEEPDPEKRVLLQPMPVRCTVIASMVFAAAGRASVHSYKVIFDAGKAVQYFGDVIVGGDWSAKFSVPSPEGEAWLKDQLAHAYIAPTEAPQPASGAGGAPQSAPAGAAQRAAPERDRAPAGVPGERRRGAP